MSNSLVTTVFTLQNTKLNTLSSEDYSKLFADSAILHQAPMTDYLKISENYSFASTDSVKDSFGFIHSGYAFGGQRENPIQATFGPEDCSSWVAKMTGCKYLYSTVHQLYAYRNFAPESINQSEQGMVMANYTPVPSVELTKPGDVYFLRAFKKDAGPTHEQAGFSGHTGILFASDFSSRLLYTLSFNRDMPHREGFGVETFPMEPLRTEQVEKIVGFLRPK